MDNDPQMHVAFVKTTVETRYYFDYFKDKHLCTRNGIVSGD